QIKLERCDGALELVRHGVDEVRLPTAEVDGFDRESQIKCGPDNSQNQECRPRGKQGNVESRELWLNRQVKGQYDDPTDEKGGQYHEHHDADRDGPAKGAMFEHGFP